MTTNELIPPDEALLEAANRLLEIPALQKLGLTTWEYDLLESAQDVFRRWGGFMPKQRSKLLEVIGKVAVLRGQVPNG